MCCSRLLHKNLSALKNAVIDEWQAAGHSSGAPVNPLSEKHLTEIASRFQKRVVGWYIPASPLTSSDIFRKGERAHQINHISVLDTQAVGSPGAPQRTGIQLTTLFDHEQELPYLHWVVQ